MRCIVTGASGFLGKALCKELLHRRYDVIAIVRKNSKRAERVPEGVNVITAELDELDELPLKYNMDADFFFHFAWNGASGLQRDDYVAQEKNIRYIRNAIACANRCGCRTFIGAGSQAEYGVTKERTYEYKSIPSPHTMYAAAKVASYSMGRVHAQKYGINMIWPRIFSVYGVGENKDTLISYLLRELSYKREPVISTGKQLWNYMYVDDCARILCDLAEDEQAAGIYNVASLDTRPLLSFITELSHIVSPDIGVIVKDEKTDYNNISWLDPDTERISPYLKKYQFISFEEGIKRRLESESF